MLQGGEDFIEVPCPSHDHPILVIPKEHRRHFLDDLFKTGEARAAYRKTIRMGLRQPACTICSCLYQALLNRLKSPQRSSPCSTPALPVQPPARRGDQRLQSRRPAAQGNGAGQPDPAERINSLLRDSNEVNYIFSRFAKINNGIYALMDVKGHNAERLMGLHNIISEGTHKVEDIEENVTSLFLALMNPEDRSTSRISSPSSIASSISRFPMSSICAPRWRSTAISSAPILTIPFCRGCCTISPG